MICVNDIIRTKKFLYRTIFIYISLMARACLALKVLAIILSMMIM